MARSWTDDLTVRVKLVAVSADDDAGREGWWSEPITSCTCCFGSGGQGITSRALEALGRVVQAVRRG